MEFPLRPRIVDSCRDSVISLAIHGTQDDKFITSKKLVTKKLSSSVWPKFCCRTTFI